MITLVAVLAGVGWLPASATGEVVTAPAGQPHGPAGANGATGAIRLSGAATTGRGAAKPEPSPRRGGATAGRTATVPVPVPVPADSGEGRRIVFDMSAQRVWLVDGDGQHGDRVRRTYLVSGSVSDNLHPGTYAVYSRSRHAWGIDDSGTMQYMVRFAHGRHAAIGFHDIPVKDGVRLQTRAQLGSPQSHGCIRQRRPDAKALWRFAPVGTTVVVVT